MPLVRQFIELLREFLIFVHDSIARLKSLKYQSSKNIKLNIGCGSNIKAGWINIDQFHMADLRLDIRRSFPFKTHSIEIIYSEHVFEHFEYPSEAKFFLKESLRVLKPGGKWSVGVPDSEWAVRSYVDGDERYYKLAREQWHPSYCTTRMHHLNFHFRQGRQHKYSYDFETLKEVLLASGFVNVERRAFDSQLDSVTRQEGTLYVDAFAPQ